MQKRRWWHRWTVVAYLKLYDSAVDTSEIAYSPRYFFWHISAQNFQRKLHRAHGPGMLRSVCVKMSKEGSSERRTSRVS